MHIKKIIIHDQNKNVKFKGSPLSLPYKKSSIIEKSILLFNDHDPCVIHESYATFQLSEELIGIINSINQKEIPVNDLSPLVSFIDFSKYINCVLSYEVKK